MTVPDYRHVPQKLYTTGLFDLRSHDGQAAFTDAVVATLNGIDPNFRHLKKKPGQTHIHRHGEDSVLYLLPNNRALAVDFTGGANGPNPQPGWGVGEHVYTHADAHDPDDHGLGESAPAPTPQFPPYPFPEDAVDGAGVFLFNDFDDAKEAPNAKMFRFAFRVCYSWLTKEVPTLADSVIKHRTSPIDGWRKLLGLAPTPPTP